MKNYESILDKGDKHHGDPIHMIEHVWQLVPDVFSLQIDDVSKPEVLVNLSQKFDTLNNYFRNKNYFRIRSC
jgi:hypothetical protein